LPPPNGSHSWQISLEKSQFQAQATVRESLVSDRATQKRASTSATEMMSALVSRAPAQMDLLGGELGVLFAAAGSGGLEAGRPCC
jgi:hypothetical protein